MSELTIREIADDDIAQVIALWHATGVARPWNDPARDIAFARRDKHSTVLVGIEAGEIVASAMVGEDGHRAGSTTLRSTQNFSAADWAAS